MTNRRVVIVLLLLLCSTTFGQEPKPATFEVASVKSAVFPSDAAMAAYARGGGTCVSGRMTVAGKRASISLTSLCGLIRFAYEVQEFQISGMPKWMTTVDRSLYYDIEATVADSAESLTTERVRGLLRPLLAERFRLKFHRETRALSVYLLTVAKNGPKLDGTTPQACVDALKVLGPTGHPGTMINRGLYISCQPTNSMGQLAQRLTLEGDRPVIDNTGVTGGHVFELRWAGQSQPNDSDLPSLFTAIEEQLGLKLEASRSEVEILVIDRAEPPTAN